MDDICNLIGYLVVIGVIASSFFMAIGNIVDISKLNKKVEEHINGYR